MSYIPERYRSKLRKLALRSNDQPSVNRQVDNNFVLVQRWIDTFPWLELAIINNPTNQALTTTYTAVTGFSTSLTAARPNAVSIAVLVCDFEETASGFGNARGRVLLDGVTMGSQLCAMNEAAGEATVAQAYYRAGLTDITHTFSVEVSKSINAGTVTCKATHSTLLVGILG